MSDNEQDMQRRTPIERYALGVAGTLLGDGVAVEDLYVVAAADPRPGQPEVECSLYPPVEWARRHLHPGAVGVSLDWDCVSGWSLYLEWVDSDLRRVERTWYLGAGLASPVADVAAFVAAILVDGDTAGTHDKPVYRQAGDARLDQVLSEVDQLTDNAAIQSLAWSFSLLRQRALHQHLAGDLIRDADVRLVPLRGGEIRALTRLLRWADASKSRDLEALIAAMASDLQARFSASKPEGTPLQLADRYRSAVDQASQKD